MGLGRLDFYGQHDYHSVRYVPLQITYGNSYDDDDDDATILQKHECGCYTSSVTTKHERTWHYEYYTIETHYLCHEHYNAYLVEEECKRIREIESKEKRDSCADILIYFAQERQKKMYDILTDLTLPYMRDLNDFCSKNDMTYKQHRGYITLYTHCSSTTFYENHECTCKWVISFKKIKYYKVAKKIYKFDMPDEDYCGNIGSITIHHCKCHLLHICSCKPSSDCYDCRRGDTFDLKPIVEDTVRKLSFASAQSQGTLLH